MHAEWWITEREEVKHLARRTQRNRPGLWGASQAVGRQSCRHLRAPPPSLCSDAPSPDRLPTEVAGQRLGACSRGANRKTDRLKKKKKKRKIRKKQQLFYFISACWRLCNLSAHRAAPAHRSARSPALLQPKAWQGPSLQRHVAAGDWSGCGTATRDWSEPQASWRLPVLPPGGQARCQARASAGARRGPLRLPWVDKYQPKRIKCIPRLLYVP